MTRFKSFVVFAEMRTGSNFLEANLNALDGITCHGEAFNPHFVGYPSNDDLLGVTKEDRERDPFDLLDRIKTQPGLNGFRYFNDHDPRIFDKMMDDLTCAKIILTRNPVESFVSLGIARATGQWRLTNVTHAKSEKIEFDPEQFQEHLSTLQAFQIKLLNRLQTSGQTAFYVDYEDLQDVDVLNGLAMHLGVDARAKSLNKKLKKQNPEPLSSKVHNFEEMETALASVDRFNLTRTPNFEPRRGPVIPTFVAAPESALLFLPLRSGPNEPIRRWLAALDGRPVSELKDKFSQNSLRKWLSSHTNHRSFSVLRHPVARAHSAFCEHILSADEGSYTRIRETLKRVHNVPVPDDPDHVTYDIDEHRKAFLAFLEFLKANLAKQTAVRVDGAWASQVACLQGISEFIQPDMIIRETDMRNHLALLASQVGKTQMPKTPTDTDPLSDRLRSIYDSNIEQAARDAYGRDYETFGFRDWIDEV